MGLKGGFGYNIDHERNNPDVTFKASYVHESSQLFHAIALLRSDHALKIFGMHLDIDILKYVCMHGRQKSCFKWTGIEKRYPIWTIVLLKRFFNHLKFTCRFNQYGTLWDIDTDESASYLKYQTSLKIFKMYNFCMNKNAFSQKLTILKASMFAFM